MSVRSIRQSKGMTIRELSEKSGKPYRTIQDWELYGRGQDALRTAKKLADALGCRIEELIED